ncbi:MULTISPECIES: DoxX family protein [unclassified Rhizobium]|uniref:DoxX family protein n=1 Tax=unclassified Rhizobium TaxID=2613769 RepID=UPI001AD97F4B|nr:MULTISPECIES: DoxX family protein [unclassified Rhizobium]MBO9099716.1 DoxX family protein [Rhizobium sp. L58/93]MBO9131752.1 DoxX family protein [Rhizobium sp. B209b/85]MBO9169706.1 DoxX family protein [Rhizobium sp. L245/93]MBO9185664.1 DoxX family protein [Rhizobium sp. E27B/91]QXZ82430.1 DoxX family protein [Rhizobium sp. K1/93]
MNTTTLNSPRILTISIWVLRVLVALMFLAAATMKLTSQPMMVAEFEQVGLGQWFRFLTGGLELIGAIAVLVPRTSILGALLLLLVDAGAFVAQIAVLHMDWVHTIVIGAVIALLIYLQRRTTA